jgi:tRNA A-37 threonylcarbamoyl transferase component Bud32
MSQPGELLTNGVRWCFPPGVNDLAVRALFGPQGLRLPEWLADGQARIVKRGADRTVYRVVLPTLDFYLKEYRLPDTRALLREWVRPRKARIEFEHALALAERHLPTVQPLALGETLSGTGPRRSYLLTETLPDSQPLGTFLETTFRQGGVIRPSRLRQYLAVALGELVARMHAAGVTHHDLHPGNFLLRLTHEEAPELYLIDLHAVRFGAALGWPAARANLVLLNRWFALRAERTDRLRFWCAYRRFRQGPETPRLHEDPAARRAVSDLERRTLASNLRFWRRHDHNCLGKGRYFRRVRCGSVVGHAVSELSEAVVSHLLADPDAPFRRPDATVLKNSRSSTVVEFDLPCTDGPRRVVYKRFAVTKWSAPWLALFRASPALRSYVLGHGLRLRCLPTPRPLAVWHRRRHGLPHEGYLLTEKLADACDLVAFVKHLDSLPADERRCRLRCLIDQVAQLVRDLHGRHLSHRDLKAPNILVSPASEHVNGTGEGLAAAERGARWLFAAPAANGTALQVWFIDLVGVRRHGKLSRRRRVQNLARLHASFYRHPGLTRTDKLRFLRVYLRWGLRGRIGWKRWWRQIEEATRAKVARNLRNGRPLG